MAVVAIGAAAGLALVGATYALLHAVLDLDFADGGGAVLAAFVTAIVGGGAAGLTMKNINLKRADSRRAANLMFDGQFEKGAALLGGESESEVLAGSLLLGSLLRESPRHAQACADLLCAALRKSRPGDLDPDEEDRILAQDPPGLDKSIAEGDRMRNSIAAAISRAVASAGAPAHVGDVRWNFDWCRFGDHTAFRSCTFGPGTGFAHTAFKTYPDFSGSVFKDSVRFEHIWSPQGLDLVGVTVRGTLDVLRSYMGRPGSDGSYGLLLTGATLEGLFVEELVTNGNLMIDAATINGRVQIGNVKCREALANEAHCDGHFEIHNVAAQGDVSLRGLAVRKQLTVTMSSGRALDISDVKVGGSVRVEANTFEHVAESAI